MKELQSVHTMSKHNLRIELIDGIGKIIIIILFIKAMLIENNTSDLWHLCFIAVGLRVFLDMTKCILEDKILFDHEHKQFFFKEGGTLSFERLYSSNIEWENADVIRWKIRDQKITSASIKIHSKKKEEKK